MLQRASEEIAARSAHTLIIGRSRERLDHFARRATPGLVTATVDYRDTTALQQALATARQHGPIDLVVAWIHDPIDPVLEIIAANLGAPDQSVSGGKDDKDDKPARLILIQSSATAEPGRDDAPHSIAHSIAQHANIALTEVILGFVIEHGDSRWLTHQEISDGVIASINLSMQSQEHHRRDVVGTIRPWGLRPSESAKPR